jgi:hypothetical protein
MTASNRRTGRRTSLLSAPFDRRELLKACGLGVLGYSASGWLPLLANQAAQAAQPRTPRRHCVLLWMTGGPSQTDTFDMKPGHSNGGEFSEIATRAPGLRFSEHLPKLADQSDKLAVVRSLSTKEGDHGRGTYLMRTGQQPRGPVRYPTIGSSLSKQLVGQRVDSDEQSLNYVSIAPYRAFNQAAFSPGFLGPKHAALTVGATDNIPANPQDDADYADLRVDDLESPGDITREQRASRVRIWRGLQDRFLKSHATASAVAHDTVFRRALRLMDSNIARAFDLSEEPEVIRQAYGTGRFGQGCLMARRLIERGVPFVEVSLGEFAGGSFGWDTHQDNFAAVRSLSTQLDNGWGTLMQELDERGLLESTTFLWMGEFGRTPKINDNAGRDHFPAAWSCVLGGGGIQGGQAFGKTGPDGMEVVEGKVDVGDVLATLCEALSIDPDTENISDQLRPIKIAEGSPIKELVLS